MTRWLVLLTSPLQQIHDARARALIDPAQKSYEVLASVSAARSSTDGEIPGVKIGIANERGQAMAIYRDPPLGAEAVLYRHDGVAAIEEFRGIVTGARCAAAASLEISA